MDCSTCQIQCTGHKEMGIEINADLRQRLCDFMSGMRRKVVSQKKENGFSIMEGKRKISFKFMKNYVSYCYKMRRMSSHTVCLCLSGT
jgi:hypothetical protein